MADCTQFLMVVRSKWMLLVCVCVCVFSNYFPDETWCNSVINDSLKAHHSCCPLASLFISHININSLTRKKANISLYSVTSSFCRLLRVCSVFTYYSQELSSTVLNCDFVRLNNYPGCCCFFCISCSLWVSKQKHSNIQQLKASRYVMVEGGFCGQLYAV